MYIFQYSPILKEQFKEICGEKFSHGKQLISPRYADVFSNM